MQQHEENIKEVFLHTQEKLAGEIKAAETEKKLPKEAVVVTITNSIVFWGNEVERKRFKKKWLAQQASQMQGEMKYRLQKLGRVVSVKPINGGVGEIWNVWDSADIHMTDEARARVEGKASPATMAEQEKIKAELRKMDEQETKG